MLFGVVSYKHTLRNFLHDTLQLQIVLNSICFHRVSVSLCGTRCFRRDLLRFGIAPFLICITLYDTGLQRRRMAQVHRESTPSTEVWMMSTCYFNIEERRSRRSTQCGDDVDDVVDTRRYTSTLGRRQEYIPETRTAS